jgi:hypothetical protein
VGMLDRAEWERSAVVNMPALAHLRTGETYGEAGTHYRNHGPGWLLPY